MTKEGGQRSQFILIPGGKVLGTEYSGIRRPESIAAQAASFMRQFEQVRQAIPFVLPVTPASSINWHLTAMEGRLERAGDEELSIVANRVGRVFSVKAFDLLIDQDKDNLTGQYQQSGWLDRKPDEAGGLHIDGVESEILGQLLTQVGVPYTPNHKGDFISY